MPARVSLNSPAVIGKLSRTYQVTLPYRYIRSRYLGDYPAIPYTDLPLKYISKNVSST